MKKQTVYIGLAVLIVGGLAISFLSRQKMVTNTAETETSTTSQAIPSPVTPTVSIQPIVPISFSLSKKSAHYVSNTPAHEATLTELPNKVVITFNFDLAEPSVISVKKNGAEVGTGETSITGDKLVLERMLADAKPGGLYDVSYSACWADKSCHDGNFQFAVTP